MSEKDKLTEQEEMVDPQAEAANEQEEAQDVNEQAEETETEEEKDEVQLLQDQVNELKDKNLRLAAEFDNYRKRTAKERVELIATAGKDTVKDLLDVVDDSQRALKQMESDTDIDSVREGAKLVFHKLQHILQQKGLKEMDCTGKEFDADLHEAITEIPAPSEDMKGKILDVVQPGYYLNDKLIRHAKVVVGS